MENYSHLNKEAKNQFWQKHFKSWEESNLSQKKYCEENSVSYWSFKTWYAKLKPEVKTKTKSFIKLKPLKITNAYSGKIEIIITDKIKISVDECISENNLKKIFSAFGILP
jgi:hypothetical protein